MNIRSPTTYEIASLENPRTPIGVHHTFALKEFGQNHSNAPIQKISDCWFLVRTTVEPEGEIVANAFPPQLTSAAPPTGSVCNALLEKDKRTTQPRNSSHHVQN
ncbi:hypothetical protein AVEN_212064-1 [Araneus ventricosus]|uniref:Uncharacterized protein n=1 Tax=Araneus ventricosus TaxID=182803 RepID=A0A4Y2GM91_ARAVE|nr:hypothetical protein AVEN_212064-1 [Araneus ventricosus]